MWQVLEDFFGYNENENAGNSAFFYFIKQLSSVIFFGVSLLSAQNLTGVVQDEAGNGLSANVILKKNDFPVDFKITTSTGKFMFNDMSQIQENDTLKLEINKNGYQTITENFVYNSNKFFDFQIILLETVVLKEILIEAKRTPIKLRTDTVEYNAESFKDGSEKVIEDLLKKLPGIQVENDGKIKFKGKEISKLLLEGDDLFDRNYKTGSRNISVDVVDKIQAIDNYSENSLLKGIENSKKVALNVVLKPGTADISGDATIGYGITNRYDTKLNIISLTKNNKNFSTASFNNTGNNYTPYDYLQLNSGKSITEPYLQHTSLFKGNLAPLDINSKLQNLNQTMFANTNHIHRINDKLSGRLIVNFMKDKLRHNQRSITDYNIPGEVSILTDIQQNIEKKPKIFNPEIKLNWKNKENILLNTDISFFYEKVGLNNSLLTNYTENLESQLQLENKYLLAKSNFTYKLNKNLAWETQLIGAGMKDEAKLRLDPAINRDLDIYESANLVQLLDAKREFYQLKSTLYGKNKSENTYEFQFVSSLKSDDFDSSLNDLNGTNEINNVSLDHWLNEINSKININFRKLEIEPKVKLVHHRVQYIQQIDSVFNIFFIEPEMQVIYKADKNNMLRFSGRYTQDLLPVEDLFQNYILLNFRDFRRNSGELFYRKDVNFSLGYSYINHYTDINVVASVFHTIHKNQFLSEYEIYNNYSQLSNYLYAENSRNFGTFLMAEKFIMPIESKIRLNTTVTRVELLNRINNSDIRRNWATIWDAELFTKSAFDFIFNFDNILKHKQVIFESDNSKKNNTKGWSNQFSTYWKINPKWFFTTTWNWYIPDTNSNSEHHFLDASIRYNNDKWELRLEGMNLLGTKNFTNTSVSDFYQSQKIQQLNEKYVILILNFKF